jgi:hypothetical protein
MENEQSKDTLEEILSRLKRLQAAGDKSHTEELSTATRLLPPQIPLIDPTANVLSLVNAETKRQDDLREAENKRLDELRKQQIMFENAIQKVREQAQKDLSAAESNRINAITLAESRRIDALLAAATGAVSLASEKAQAQAATLAQQVATSAEALRAQVASTSSATTTLITQLRESLEKRLQLVEQNQYQGVGVTMQRTEGRQRMEWSVGTIVGIVGTLAALVMGISRMLGK